MLYNQKGFRTFPSLLLFEERQVKTHVDIHLVRLRGSLTRKPNRIEVWIVLLFLGCPETGGKEITAFAFVASFKRLFSLLHRSYIHLKWQKSEVKGS